MAAPSNEEQLQLELINRLRTDPGGEYARLVGVQANIDGAANYFGVDFNALQAQLNALTPVAALAWNSLIADAAEDHSALMIANDEQSHQLPGEAGLGARIAAAGYQNLRAAGENIYAFADDGLFGHAGFVIDWGYDAGEIGPDGFPIAGWQTSGDGIQDPAGHRVNLMSATFTEIGIDVTQETNPTTQVGDLVITQDLATSWGYQAQFVGVVINDTDNDDFYDIGEGMGGVSVALSDGTTTYNTVTWASGGWQIEVPAGTYTLTFSGGALTGVITKTATLGSSNVKVDAEADEAAPGGTPGDDAFVATNGADAFNGGTGTDSVDYAASNAGVAVNLQTGVGSGGFAAGDTYSGIEDVYGSALADTLTGNTGNNTLDGKGGLDTAIGGIGDDIYYVDQQTDIVTENAGEGTDFIYTSSSYQLALNAERLIAVEGEAGAVGLTARNNYNNIIVGNSSTNVFIDQFGRDTFVGGGGADYFRFIANLDGVNNVNRINDFDTADDQFQLLQVVYSEIDIGLLDASEFVLGTSATDANDRIIYDSTNGVAYYDPDGTGAAVQIEIVNVNAGTVITADDFQIF